MPRRPLRAGGATSRERRGLEDAAFGEIAEHCFHYRSRSLAWGGEGLYLSLFIYK